MKNESRLLARFTSLVLIGCSITSTAIIYHTRRNPAPVPLAAEGGNVWKFDNPSALHDAITIEQYADFYRIDPRTVEALCASGRIAGAGTFEQHTRHWLIPGSAIQSVAVADVAAAHGVAERTVRDWIDAGRISPAPLKVGREWRIAPDYTVTPLP